MKTERDTLRIQKVTEILSKELGFDPENISSSGYRLQFIQDVSFIDVKGSYYCSIKDKTGLYHTSICTNKKTAFEYAYSKMEKVIDQFPDRYFTELEGA